MKSVSIEERAIALAHYIIDSKDTVRGAAKKFGISKSKVHKDVTLQNGRNKTSIIPESIEINGVFLNTKNKENMQPVGCISHPFLFLVFRRSSILL